MWEVIEVGHERHVIPQNDLRPHDRSTECWCRPFDDDGVTVHNAMDRREYLERGEANAH